MTSDNIVDIARGLIDSETMRPPLRVLVPRGTNLGEHEEGENVTLEQRIRDISPDIKEVRVGKSTGVQIESVGDETAAGPSRG